MWSSLFTRIPNSLPKAVGVACFRLSIGHDYIQKHLYRIGLTHTDACPLCESEDLMTGDHLNICPAVLYCVSFSGTYGPFHEKVDMRVEISNWCYRYKLYIKLKISAYYLPSTVSKMNDFSELDDWDPMAEDFYNREFNTYRDIQKAITHDLAKLYIRNIPKDFTEEKLLALMSEGNRRVRHICLFPVQKYKSTTAGIVGFYTEAMAAEALKIFSNHDLNFLVEYATRKMTEKVMLKQIELWMPVQKVNKVNPPQPKKVNLPQSKEVNIPQSKKINVLESTKVNVPQSTKTNLPESTKVSVPQTKKALSDEDECKENLQPNQAPVESLSSKPPICKRCGNQFQGFIFSGVYCRRSCWLQSVVDNLNARKLEAEKLNKVEEKTTTSEQSDKEKSVSSNQSDKEKPDPVSETKELKSVEETEEESYKSMVEWNRRRRLYIRKEMAEQRAEGFEKTQKRWEELARTVNSCEFGISEVEKFCRSKSKSTFA